MAKKKNLEDLLSQVPAQYEKPVEIPLNEIPPTHTVEVPKEAASVIKYKEALPQEIIDSVVLYGDLSKLSPAQKVQYVLYRCKNLGLDPAAKPFDLLVLNGKQVLYANKSCATQLRDIHGISTKIIEEREWNGLLLFRVRAWFPDGRQHEDEGFASVKSVTGDALGNARLKALTKATRRAILNLCGLGELDETEVDSIPHAKKASVFAEAAQVLEQKVDGGWESGPEPAQAPVQEPGLVQDAEGNFWPAGYQPEK